MIRMGAWLLAQSEPRPPEAVKKICRHCDGRRTLVRCLDCGQPIARDGDNIGCGTEGCAQTECERDCPYCLATGFDQEQPLKRRFRIDPPRIVSDAFTPEEAIRQYGEYIKSAPPTCAHSLGWRHFRPHGHELMQCPAPPSSYWRVEKQVSSSTGTHSKTVYLAVPTDAGEVPWMRHLTHTASTRAWGELAKAPRFSLVWDDVVEDWVEVPVFLRANGLLNEACLV